MPANLLVILTGSIAGFKACEAISQLVQRGHRVRTVATAAALRFTGAPTLEGLTGAPVLADLFAAGAALEHVQLTRWADLVIICPATAATLNRLAAGLADDLPGALFLAHDRRKPWLVAPAMNPAMWSHPATQASVEKLRGWGVRFLPVGEGRTACGESGEGRLAEPGAIVAAVEAILARPARRLRVLVTGGGTAEPIDGVRVLTNTSTGRTAAGIAGRFALRGHDVDYLHARNAAPVEGCRDHSFLTFADLDAALGLLLAEESFDAVVHAAAVSDYAVETITVDGRARPRGDVKLESNAGRVTLRLRPNPKLVDSLRARSRNSALKLVAFKLTHGASPAAATDAVRDLFAHSAADWVVYNDLANRVDGGEFPATIHAPDRRAAVACANRRELAEQLEVLLTQSIISFPLPIPSPHAALS